LLSIGIRNHDEESSETENLKEHILVHLRV